MERDNHSKTIAAMQACVDHARALLVSARAVQAAGHPNIAFHLAALTLEEIGRRELIGLQSISATRPVPPAWVHKHVENHIQKLFWCFFGAVFSMEKLTKERLESIQTFSQHIHTTRLAGLYVDNAEDRLTIPAEAIGIEEAQTLINIAAARLDMAESEKLRDHIPQDVMDLQLWFLTATEDLEKRRMIMSGASMTKLAEFKNTQAWIQWLKEEFDRAEAEGRAAVEEELKRSRGLPTQGTKNKWKLRIRIFSQSHLIRPKTLSQWNKTCEWIKLISVSGKKDQLIVEFTLLDNVLIEGLWWFGWGLARHFVTALNIGTMGFWWWQMPRQVSKFYESIEDMEKKQFVGVERSPSLKIDWGENRVLTERDLNLVAQCFAALPGPEHREEYEPYNYYIGGLTFLSLNDVHWQCESTAFRNFFESMRAMMAQSGEWNLGTLFEPALMHFLDDLFPGMDERDHYTEIFRAFERNAVDTVTITLKEVAFMKLFCDAYYLQKIRPTALNAMLAAKA
jgi:AbiV family abortive infection protein